MSETRKLKLNCPCCEAQLVVDAATGEVLAHREKEREKAGGKTLDGLFEEMERGKSEAEETFEREVAAMKDRDRLLEEKFREALKRAEEEPDDEPPPRPWDLD